MDNYEIILQIEKLLNEQQQTNDVLKDILSEMIRIRKAEELNNG